MRFLLSAAMVAFVLAGCESDEHSHDGDGHSHTADAHSHAGDTQMHAGDTQMHAGDTQMHAGDTQMHAGDGDGQCDPAGSFQCAGMVLQECGAGGWEDAEDCGASGKMCHAEMGHCM